MNIIVLTPVRLLGDGLASCFSTRPQFTSVTVVHDLGALRTTLAKSETNVVLIDVTQGVDLIDIRALAVQWPEIPLVALGLTEERQEVIKCGRAGFAGYVPRDASIDALCKMLHEIVGGRLACPPDISCSLLRALFRAEAHSEGNGQEPVLTRRESEVLELLGHGFSNKEIGRELCLSVATVKHHVHHILEKLKLGSRTQAMRRVRDAPWLAHSASLARKCHGDSAQTALRRRD